MELDFDKYCVVDGSPTTVLPTPQHPSKVGNRKSNGKPQCGNHSLSLDEDLIEIISNICRSASYRDITSNRANRETLCQNSEEARLLSKTDTAEERKKIEFSQGSATSFSLGIIDSLCSSDEDSFTRGTN
ncbi:uncharacterized protein Fot_13358 [Forsythia ovata]|uniref:Uncharacterized protein n=1 Tax=Forsythia ovata TaxID=205694 RepID=A0ABD1W379_9LAMI